jgi:phosphohistidine swiveling domain-containing protein
MHESGQRKDIEIPTVLLYSVPLVSELNQITGMAAILTFPLDVEMVEAEEAAAKAEEEERLQTRKG